MMILYNFAEALSCILYFIFSVFTLEIFFSRSSKYQFVYVLFAALLYFPLTYSPISILPNLAGSFLSTKYSLISSA